VQRLHLTVPHAVAGVLVAAALLAAGCGGARNDVGAGTTASVATDTATTATTGGAPIVVQQPKDGDHVSAPIHVAGTATVFEGTVSVVLTGQDGHTLTQKTLQATCGNGCRGSFDGRVAVPDGYTGPATLRLFEASAEDGSPLHEVDLHLTVG
jgi:hypothetical protein